MTTATVDLSDATIDALRGVWRAAYRQRVRDLFPLEAALRDQPDLLFAVETGAQIPAALRTA